MIPTPLEGIRCSLHFASFLHRYFVPLSANCDSSLLPGTSSHTDDSDPGLFSIDLTLKVSCQALQGSIASPGFLVG